MKINDVSQAGGRRPVPGYVMIAAFVVVEYVDWVDGVIASAMG